MAMNINLPFYYHYASKNKPSMNKILIVDNDKGIVDLVADWFGNQGYKTNKMYTHKGLLDKIYSFMPSILVMGIHLQGIDGRYLCSLLKSIEQTKHIKIVMLSPKPNHYQVNDEEWCADAFLYEPYNQQDMMKIAANFEEKPADV
jgi:DNA-binding response OmpR family regulator